jgi:hypothetical protein
MSPWQKQRRKEKENENGKKSRKKKKSKDSGGKNKNGRKKKKDQQQAVTHKHPQRGGRNRYTNRQRCADTRKRVGRKCWCFTGGATRKK